MHGRSAMTTSSGRMTANGSWPIRSLAISTAWPEAQLLLLADVGDLGEVADVADLAQLLDVALLLEQVLELVVEVEVVLDRALLATR